MLEIIVNEEEYWDSENNLFCRLPEKRFTFEHSLASISKWEMKWHIPYLSEYYEKTEEQARDYIRCMCFEEIDDLYLAILSSKYIRQLNEYINDSMTATWFSEKENKSTNRNNIITNEVVYGMMASLQIPFECDKWHFNRLMTLIRVCNDQNSEKKPMSKKETLEYYQQLNRARRAKSKVPH